MDAASTGPVTISTPLGDDLMFHSMGGVEGLSEPYAYEVDVVSARSDIHAADLLDRSVTVHLALDDDAGSHRHWNGLVTRFEYVDTGDDGMSRYRLTLRPWLWQLGLTADCRVFQNLSVPDIVARVFEGRGFHDFESALTETYAPREYVVQFRESDLCFVSRMLEREGIYYFFRHEDGRHVLVLADSPQVHEPASGCASLPYRKDDGHRDATMQYVRRWSALGQLEAGAFAATDFDFTQPRVNLLARSVSAAPAADRRIEIYDYPGGFDGLEGGESVVRLRLEQARRDARRCRGETNARNLTVGATFELTDHPRDEENQSYLVVSARYRVTGHAPASSGTNDEDPFGCTFVVADADRTFRRALTTPRPVAHGPQTATVVGPESQTIWTDQYGRVKVQFHWDRLGHADENSSCWVRVSQAWAGRGFGAQFIPRIRDEVVVEFLEGDLDRPIITGSVYNAANMPPFSLPENQTQSGVRTRSAPGGMQVNANEIRFEDSIGNEELFVQAERDQTTLVKHDQSVTVGGDRRLAVAGNESVSIGMGRTTNVAIDDVTSVLGASTLTVAGLRSVQVTGDDSHVVKGSVTVAVEGSESRAISGDQTVHVTGEVDVATDGDHTETYGDDYVARHAGHRVVVVGGPDGGASTSLHVEGPATAFVTETIDVSAVKGITIRCGKSKILMTPDAVTITAPTISLVAQEDLDLTGDKVDVTGGDSIDLGSTKVTIASSGAQVLLDSNATVQGAKVQLQGGGGASAQSQDKKTKITTIKLVDQDGKPLANRHVLLREGGEGGVVRTVVLDDSGSIEVEGDGPFDALVPDFPEAKPS
ncbi:MAG TPA: type VI secretion system tip protein TssI/VgrG [Polyangiaceae bacterium]|nr:type VI secretion system tip protein TssI/VgrG [Polyangiaceae bacterium]